MRVLIMTITAGEGHNSTANALCAYLRECGVETEVMDTYKYINRMLSGTVARGYLLVTDKAKYAFAGGYRLAEKRRSGAEQLSGTRLTHKILSLKIHHYINEYKPDVIIFTHIFAGIIIDVLLQEKKIKTKTVGVLTDFVFHPYWEEGTHIDYIVTADSRLNIQAKKKGFRPEQILPLGIPVHPKFAGSGEQAAARAELGLDPEKSTLILMGGGAGYGALFEYLRRIDRMDIDLQIITVCGRNDKLKNQIDKYKSNKPVLNLGFSQIIDRVMDASDVIVTKPGGLTTSEALAKRLPMIIIDPIPGQEMRNREFLLNSGVACAVSKTYSIEEAVSSLFAGDGRLEVMRGAIDLLRKPNATRDICEFVMELVEG